MKHVFVETNFIIGVARPTPEQPAERLLARAGVDVTLHLPWCSISEASRTLERIIDDDLGFENAMLARALRLRPGEPGLHREIQRFAKIVRTDRRLARADISASIARATKDMQIIAPSQAVLDATLEITAVKSLKPFDEMVLGAVLAKAKELHAAGERELYFCNLNKSDFSPFDRAGTSVAEPLLEAAYSSRGLTYLPSFDVPK